MRITTLLALLLPTMLGAEEKPIDFNREIRPILSNHCFQCHGPDRAARKARLRLDEQESATKKLRSGETAVVPGKPQESELVRRVFSDEPTERMPPPEIGKPLTPEQKDLLKRWIAQDGTYEPHWAYVAPIRSPLPKVENAGWARGALDLFILRRLRKEGLQPTEQADRITLARRASLHLTGLPPTLEMVDQFVNDPRPNAYETYVERLLASPAFGERWGRVWLDLARYADSAGYADDPPRTIWRYRDWVIDALNRNQPFDQFTIEQIAGDLLPSPTTEQILATAFHRNTMTNSEGGTSDEEFRNAAVVDRVNTTMQVWMGMTMACAQCHDHKYDPISQEEYFELFAIFNTTEDADRRDEAPLLTELSPAQEERRAELQARIKELEKDPEKKKELDAARKALAAIKGITTPIMREQPKGKQRATKMQIRGNYLDTGEEVVAGLPSAFHEVHGRASLDRLRLAQWLVDRKNPLTARVIVNRFWEQLFGLGLVETSEDFGMQGEPPSHPELLDWLAVELMETGWDMKQLLRRIVTSATYRQSSRVSEELLKLDPNNRLYARGPRFRLSAEMIRDQALFVSGLLSRKMHGPSVRPPQPQSGLRAAFGGSTDWRNSVGEDRYRRGLYTSWRRSDPYPSMATFDAPSREVCTVRRIRTNTPLQALVTLNDPVYVEAAQALARRVLGRTEMSTEERGRYAFRLVIARSPSDKELSRILSLYQKVRAQLEEEPENAKQLSTNPLGPLPAPMKPSEAGAWTVVANVLLNLDEALAGR